VAAEIEKVNTSTKQPILVGTASVEDSQELASILRNKGIHFELLNAKNHAKEAEIIKNAGTLGAVTISTNMAGRGTDIKITPESRQAGGLYVIGTERHESRRIDNQLRGRSGRQGDPGVTRFFISIQDTLFKRFAIEKLQKSADELDNDFYNSGFFNRLLNSTQKKVESVNFDMRKNLIDYDMVLSNQRELVYKQRDQILLIDDNSNTLLRMTRAVAKEIASKNIDAANDVYVDAVKVANMLNYRFLQAQMIKPTYFNECSVENATDKIENILNVIVSTRLQSLGLNANNIIKDIMIQNFDYC
jgi:preprotein translocase subunit SecA